MGQPRRRPWLPGSVRFRLTAWYALLLALILGVLGVAVLARAEDQLRTDIDTRLEKTAADIGKEVKKRLGGRSLYDLNDPDVFPDLGSFASRGLQIQIVDKDDNLRKHSEYAPSAVLLEAKSDSGPDSGADAAPGSQAGSDADPGRRLDPADAEPVFGTTPWKGTDLRAVRFPIVMADNGGQQWYVGSVLVGEQLGTLAETLDSLRQVLLLTSAIGLALAIAGGWLLASRALRPVDRITAAAARIAAGDGSARSLTSRLDVPPAEDEISRLASTFNAMLDRLEASFRAQQRFVADASHELRTPLTAVRGNIDVLARQLRSGKAVPSGDLAAAVADVQRESARMGRLLDDLLLLARADADPADTGAAAMRQPLRPVYLDELATEAVRSATGLAQGQLLAARTQPATVAGDRDRLLQLLLILLDNALRHTPPGKRVVVEVERGAGGTAALAVWDEGEGIAAQHLPHLFDRFYRADGARGRGTGGTGLGLTIARAIARAHGGDIAVESAPGRGSRFTVTLPALTARPAADAADARERGRAVRGADEPPPLPQATG